MKNCMSRFVGRVSKAGIVALAAVLLPSLAANAAEYMFWWGSSGGSSNWWETKANWDRTAKGEFAPSGSTHAVPASSANNYVVINRPRGTSYIVKTGLSNATRPSVTRYIMVNGSTAAKPFWFFGPGINLTDSKGGLIVGHMDYIPNAADTDAYLLISRGEYTIANQISIGQTVNSNAGALVQKTAAEYAGHLTLDQGLDPNAPYASNYNASSYGTYTSDDLIVTTKTIDIRNGDITVRSPATQLTVTGATYIGQVPNTTSAIYHIDGTTTLGGWLCVGRDNGASGIYSQSGGTVTSSGSVAIADTVATTTGSFILSGGTFSCTGYVGLGQYGEGTLTISGDAEMTVGDKIILGNTTNSSATANHVLNLNGGVLCTKLIKRGEAPATATTTVNFDGGTFKAKAAGTIIEANQNLAVLVGNDGGTIDAGGHAVEIAAAIAPATGSTGGMTFKGGGAITLSGAMSYAGATTVDAGANTQLIVPSKNAADSVKANGFVVTVSEPVVSSVPVLTISGNDVFTSEDLADFSFADAAAATTFGASFALSGDAKSVIVIFSTVPAWTGAAGDGKMSTAGNWLANTVPAAGQILDFTRAAADEVITADISGNPVFRTATFGANCFTFAGEISFATLVNDHPGGRFSIAADSTVHVTGDYTLSSSTADFVYAAYTNNGRLDIGGKLLVEGSAKGYPCYNGAATIAVDGVYSNGSGDHFKLNGREKNAPRVNWEIGAYGLVPGAKNFWNDYPGNGTGANIKAMADFAIGGLFGQRNVLNIDPNGHTVTVNAKVYRTTGSTTVNGSNGGEVVLDYVTDNSQPYDMNITASGNTVLSLNAGSKATTGTVDVGAGATLRLPEAGTGTATIGDALTLAGGSTVRFDNLNLATTPLSVGSAAVSSGTATVLVKGTELAAGRYPLAKGVTTAILASLQLNANEVATGAWLTVLGDTLYLIVGDVCTWTGAGDGVKFSDGDNWSTGTAPTDGADLVISLATDTTLKMDIADFAPNSIKFLGAGTVTLEQDNGTGNFVGAPIFNNATDAKHPVINVPVVIAAEAEMAGQFAAGNYFVWQGGLTVDNIPAIGADEYIAGSVTLREGWNTADRDNAIILSGATLTVPSHTNSTDPEIVVQNGGTFHVTGDVTLTAEAKATRAIVNDNAGIVRVDGTVTATGSANPRPSVSNTGNTGVFYLGGVVHNADGDHFKLNNNGSTYVTTIYMGAGGVSVDSVASGASKQFWFEANKQPVTIYPTADYTFAANYTVRYPVDKTSSFSVVFGTTDPDTSTDHTVTVDGTFANDGCIKVIGGGTFVLNESATMTVGATYAQPAFQAADTATIEVAGGKQLGGGKAAFGGGTTLKVKNVSDGAVTIPSELKIGTGFTLSADALPASGPLVTVDSLALTTADNSAAAVTGVINLGGAVDWNAATRAGDVKLIGWTTKPTGIALSAGGAVDGRVQFKIRDDGLYAVRLGSTKIFIR